MASQTIFYHDLSIIVDVVMWENYRISVAELQFFKDLTRKTDSSSGGFGSSSIIWNWH